MLAGSSPVRFSVSVAFALLALAIHVSTAAAADNLVTNGGFEISAGGTPSGWAQDVWDPARPHTLVRDTSEAHSGNASVRVELSALNDARWIQTVQVQPFTEYRLSGWVKTSNVAHSPESIDAGANLSFYGTWTHSPGVFSTNDWTYQSVLLTTGTETQLVIGARIGYWAGTTTGTAWFDDLRLEATSATALDDAPSWNVLVLIYSATDFTYQDPTGTTQRFQASMTTEEMQRADSAARRFFTDDVPALTSGVQHPRVTVRYPAHPLGSLTATSDPCGGYYPARTDTAGDVDASFDSVVVIWDDTSSSPGSPADILTGCSGLTDDTGNAQTHATMPIESVSADQRNIFKHEWGHSILFYYLTVGKTSQAGLPRNEWNHINDGDRRFVNCQSGASYVLQDESDNAQIPNSIYNNSSGFTHDYYSGTTARDGDPTTCIGVGPAAWAAGGPMTKPKQPLQRLLNGGFEEDANADTRPDWWTTSTRVSRSSAVVHGGSFSMRHSATDNKGHTISQSFSDSFAPGKTYTFSGWVNVPPTTDSFTFSIQIVWLNSRGKVISTTTVRTISATTSGWTPASLAVNAPSTTAHVRLDMVASSLNATIYTDDFSLLESGTGWTA